jgi:hypothetical protein
MANPKPHVKLNTQKQSEGQFNFKYSVRFQDKDAEDDSEEKDYTGMARLFQTSLHKLSRDKKRREENRNPGLDIPKHIDYIRLHFQAQFDTNKYFSQYYDHFGLEAVLISRFATEGLFAVVNTDKVKNFIESIRSFIRKELEKEDTANFDRKIKFIKSFELLTSQSIIKAEEFFGSYTFRLVDFPLSFSDFSILWPALESYLKDKNIFYVYDNEENTLEVKGLTEIILEEIIDNYDIVLSVTSNLSTVIQPTRVSTPKRTYGFSINPPLESLPIIGIIDTGISSQTPLSQILINDDRFDLTGNGAFIDNTNHGTGVAALAAMGKRPYEVGYRGEMESDAILLSIKVMDNSIGDLLPSEVLKVLKYAKEVYPAVKLFVLTIGNKLHKKNDEDFSRYAVALDKFSYENDCLIVISTGNNNRAVLDQNDYNLNYFENEFANIAVPAECMNNITVGGASDNLTGDNSWAISLDPHFPALYTRKYHCNLRDYFSQNKRNKHLFKPDLLESGGDFEGHSFGIAQGERASMEVLSSDPKESFMRQVGTSYSAPLVANIAARIQHLYPELRSQTVKALILNGANHSLFPFPGESKHLLHRVSGHGFLNQNKAIFSNENSLTFLLEDEIMPGKMQLYPIRLPDYLSDGTVAKKVGLLKISVTLCFSFLPYPFNQLCYCPVHIGFALFRNADANSIMKKYADTLLRGRWSQDAYFNGKPIPYSNSQKGEFTFGQKELLSEEGIFKLAVNCKINPQLLVGEERKYEHPHKFSIALRIEENLTEAKLTGRLYNELIAINEIENIAIADIELEGTL